MAGLNRRLASGALMAALAVAALAARAAPAMADDLPKDRFEGTWGGAVGQLSAQVIVTSGEVIGFFWDQDYTDAQNVKFSADGRVLSFDFAGGHATLTRSGATTAMIEVTEAGKVRRIPLKRD